MFGHTYPPPLLIKKEFKKIQRKKSLVAKCNINLSFKLMQSYM